MLDGRRPETPLKLVRTRTEATTTSKAHLDGFGAWDETSVADDDRKEVKRHLRLAKVSDRQLGCPCTGDVVHGLHPNVRRALGFKGVRACRPLPADITGMDGKPLRPRSETALSQPPTVEGCLRRARANTGRSVSVRVSGVAGSADAPMMDAVDKDTESEGDELDAIGGSYRSRSKTFTLRTHPSGAVLSEPTAAPTARREDSAPAISDRTRVLRLDLEAATHSDLTDALVILGRRLEGRVRLAADRREHMMNWLTGAESEAQYAFNCGFEQLLRRPDCERWAALRLSDARQQFSPTRLGPRLQGRGRHGPSPPRRVT
eukprot:TRINITY_DN30833_c0_g1_i1.p1 TRINITY_DN30833_c0_g1~~TRINITY_DN30833_c0_g1_i1.p1  ORF type:complete len:318 (+),score=62.19 TRINITY_DN30833_c0_g1_i1:53-1006(+)